VCGGGGISDDDDEMMTVFPHSHTHTPTHTHTHTHTLILQDALLDMDAAIAEAFSDKRNILDADRY
jgi:hypothetical protein